MKYLKKYFRALPISMKTFKELLTETETRFLQTNSETNLAQSSFYSRLQKGKQQAPEIINEV